MISSENYLAKATFRPKAFAGPKDLLLKAKEEENQSPQKYRQNV